jgi:hypothetical protein
MLQVDLQFSFCMGATMAFMARPRLVGASKAWRQRAHAMTLVVTGIAMAPTWLYILLGWCAWETQYRWDLTTIPHWLAALFLPAISLACSLGFGVTGRLLERAGAVVAALPAAVAIGSIVWIVWAHLDRALFVGPLGAYHPGVPANLWSSGLFHFFALATIFVFVPFGYLVWRVMRLPA